MSNGAKTHAELVEDLYRTRESITLPPEYDYFVQENLLQALIRLARYKFAVKMLRPRDRVMDVGCGSGLGAAFLGQHCRSVLGLDIEERYVAEARGICRRENVDFEVGDIFAYEPAERFDVVVSTDMIEHLDRAGGEAFVERTASLLCPGGMLVLGTPSRYAAPYQGELSRADHVTLYDRDELVEMVERHYGRALAFSMNDEVVHTGFAKLAWYYFVLGVCPT